jgi:hypothetical protein
VLLPNNKSIERKIEESIQRYKSGRQTTPLNMSLHDPLAVIFPDNAEIASRAANGHPHCTERDISTEITNPGGIAAHLSTATGVRVKPWIWRFANLESALGAVHRAWVRLADTHASNATNGPIGIEYPVATLISTLGIVYYVDTQLNVLQEPSAFVAF